MSGRFLLAGLLAGFCMCASTPALATAGTSQAAAGHGSSGAVAGSSNANRGAATASLERVGASDTLPGADATDSAAPADSGTTTARCSAYFSAYGVSPQQLRWITNSARKQYSGICPAPKPSMVDYVVIFTHDVHFYPSAMPEAIRMDANGFSDWTPVTTVDTALVPQSQIDHAHHEYVWVFRVRRGSFNPGAFSAKSRAQFAKTESHNSARAAEDAFGFIAGHGTGAPGTALGQ